MLFTESFITNAGTLILSRATAQEGSLVWTAARTSNLNTDSYSEQQMSALTDIIDSGSSYTSSGAVTTAVLTDEQDGASMFCELTNDTYNGSANTLGVWAKIDGDEDDVLVIVARCGGTTPTVINPSSEGRIKAFVDFTVTFSAGQAEAIAVSELNYYASNASLMSEQRARLALSARCVTTHTNNNPSVGDEQIVLGEKTFKDTTYLRTICPNEDIIITGYDSEIPKITRISNLRNTSLNLGLAEAKAIDDGVEEAVGIGESFAITNPPYRYSSADLAQVRQEIVSCGYTCAPLSNNVELEGNLSVVGKITPDSISCADIQCGHCDINGTSYGVTLNAKNGSYDGSKVSISSGAAINTFLVHVCSGSGNEGSLLSMRHVDYVSENNFCLLGLVNNDESGYDGFRIGYRTSDGGNVAEITSTHNKINGPLTATGNASITGNLSITGNESITGNVTVTGNLSATGTILGKTPSYSNGTTTVPVGSIVLGVVGSTHPGIQGKAGETLSLAGNTIWLACGDGSEINVVSSSSRKLPAGKYVALMDYDTSQDSVVLLQRIE